MSNQIIEIDEDGKVHHPKDCDCGLKGCSTEAEIGEDTDVSFVTLCAAYITARDAQLEHRDLFGGDDITLVNVTAETFDALANEITKFRKPEITDAMVERLAKHNWESKIVVHGIVSTYRRAEWKDVDAANREAELDIARAALRAAFGRREAR